MKLIEPGTRLGPYEITGSLGTGGMGEVYRAKDTRLNRTVAIKLLPSHLSSDPDLRGRLEREARAVSILNHPHICTLHDIGHENGIDYLVMEFIDGSTLASRLQNGPLPTSEILRYSIQIADALVSAHSLGIIHRDLKPGNIMLTKSGIKLLDFGLAKMSKEAPIEELSELPTLQRQLTKEGMILGTVQYMAPEQLEGKEADERSDIFAFGAVMYEMATGRKAFEGNSHASVIAAILKEQPEPIVWQEPSSPSLLEQLIHVCLKKDPDERWQNVRDVLIQLKWIAETGASGVSRTAAKGARRSVIPWILVGLLTLSLIAAIFLRSKQPEQTGALFSSILPPEDATFVNTSIFAGPVVISPDGSKIVFVAHVGEGSQSLWVRSLDSTTAVQLKETDGAQMPFWSPNSRFIGFFADRKLKRISADGGPATTLADISEPRGGTWNQQGIILFSQDARGPLYSVSADGGKVTQITRLQRGEYTHRYPVFLPDGHHFLYLGRRSQGGPGQEPAIFVGSLDGMKPQKIVNVASNLFYASDHLLFVKEDTLVAQRFNRKNLKVEGDPVSIAGGILMDKRFSRGVFSVSSNGTLVYQTGKATTLSQLSWLDRSGNVIETVGDPAEYFNGARPEISHDGNRAIVSIVDLRTGLADIWIVDLLRKLRTRFTTGSADTFEAAWSPDDQWLAICTSNDSGGYDLLLRSATRTQKDELVLTDLDLAMPSMFSPDGQILLYQTRTREEGKTGAPDDLWMIHPFGNRKPERILAGEGFEGLAQFSPNGRYIAYVSDQSGRDEIYVTSFPDFAGKWQISSDGGTEPRWNSEGTELFYFSIDNYLTAVQVKTHGPTFDVGLVQKLFQSQIMGLEWRYDVSKDGKRFLVNRALPERASAITLVQNWTSLLPKRN